MFSALETFCLMFNGLYKISLLTYLLTWYAFYDHRPENAAVIILTAPEPTRVFGNGPSANCVKIISFEHNKSDCPCISKTTANHASCASGVASLSRVRGGESNSPACGCKSRENFAKKTKKMSHPDTTYTFRVSFCSQRL